MSPLEICALAAAAASAGMINAVAGGGTLVTFPILLFFGVSPVIANATSTVALVVGTAGSIVGFRPQLARVRGWLAPFLPVSVLGGWLGSFILTHTEDRVFATLVPFLILFATLLFLARGAFQRFAGVGSKSEPLHPAHRGVWVAIAFQFGVAIYGGYFGAGIGILMLASLGFIGLTDLHEMNALKNILGSVINLVAAVWFIVCGLVDWPRAGVMTVGALAGYWMGAHYSQRLSQVHIRHVITAIGLTISAVMFYRQFR